MLIKDSLQMQRLEWVFGIPQIKLTKYAQEKTPHYGLEVITTIDDQCCNYSSQIMDASSDDPLLQQLLYCKGKMDTLTCRCLQELLYLCINDDTICRYVYNMAPHTYQYARYSDWF